MPKPKTQSETNELLEDVLEAFAATAGLRAEIVAGQAAVRLGRGTGWLKFAVEPRAPLTSGGFGATATALRQKSERRLLVTRAVTAHQAERLRELNLPFLDAAGNAFLNEPELFVLALLRFLWERASGSTLKDKGSKAWGKSSVFLLCQSFDPLPLCPFVLEKPALTHTISRSAFVFVSERRLDTPAVTDRNVSRAFRPSGLGILFALLNQLGLENRPLRELAAAAGVSLPAAVRADGTLGARWRISRSPRARCDSAACRYQGNGGDWARSGASTKESLA